MHVKMLNYGAISPTCPECGHCPKFDYDGIKTYCQEMGFKYEFNEYSQKLKISKPFIFMGNDTPFKMDLNFEILKINHCEKCYTWIGYYKFNSDPVPYGTVIYDDGINYNRSIQELTHNIKGMNQLFGQKFIDINVYWYNNCYSKIGFNVAYQKGENFTTDIIFRFPLFDSRHHRGYKQPRDNENLCYSIGSLYSSYKRENIEIIKYNVERKERYEREERELLEKKDKQMREKKEKRKNRRSFFFK